MKVKVTQPSLYLRVNDKLQETTVGQIVDMDEATAKAGKDKWSVLAESKAKVAAKKVTSKADVK